MSRSFKKTPGHTSLSESRYSSWFKSYANRRFRRYTGPVQDGGWYKKYHESWDICDWKFLYYTKKELDRTLEEFPRLSRKRHQFYMK